MSLSTSASFSSLPNSDTFTLIVVRDAAKKVTPDPQHDLLPSHRRMKTSRLSPLGRFPPVTAASLQAAQEAAAATSQGVDADVSLLLATQTSCSRVDLGLGRPSTVARRRPNPSFSSSVTLLSSPASPQAGPRTRIPSSTDNPSTVRSGKCELDPTVEASFSATEQQSADTPTRPVPGPRKRSYAAATATSTTTANTTANEPPLCARQITRRRVTPTPGSPRCAQQTPGDAPATPHGTTTAPATTPGVALPPRHTSLGFPLAGPTQVQSPRVLVAPYGGNPLFRSLDGAALSIMAGALEADKAEDKHGKGAMQPQREGAGAEREWDATFALKEDAWLKLKFVVSLKIRLAVGRLRSFS
ncbi:hypothetical protein C8R43DRAFT_1171996 [Mycena crocata]|nr:hypothetical protein C8R43DRAFT_1171996 [Mycena crocata]